MWEVNTQIRDQLMDRAVSEASLVLRFQDESKAVGTEDKIQVELKKMRYRLSCSNGSRMTKYGAGQQIQKVAQDQRALFQPSPARSHRHSSFLHIVGHHIGKEERREQDSVKP
jgi:hypothetical protein